MRVKTCVLIIVLFGLLIYLNSLFNGFVGDDFDQIIKNSSIYSISNIPHLFTGSTYYREEINQFTGLYYRPLMLSTYAIIYTLSGQDPFFYHFVQIVIHILNSLILFFLFRKFFKNIIAFICALIFLVHPINNEAVVYIANLQDVLLPFFGLLSFYLVVNNKHLNIKKQLLLGLLILSCLFTKETGLLFILVITAYTYLFSKNKLKDISFISITAVIIYSILRFFVAKVYFGKLSAAPINHIDFQTHLINIPKIIIYYTERVFYPKDLISTQSWVVRNPNFSDFYLPLLIFISILFLGAYLGRFFYKKNVKNLKMYALFILWTSVGIGFHLQLIPLDSTVAERWFYVPFIGILGILGLLINDIKLKNNLSKVIITTIILISIFTLSIRTFIRNFDWKDSFTLYSHDIKISPHDTFLANALGTELINQGEYNQAKPYIETSLNSYAYFGNLNNMAIIYTEEKNLKKADEYFRKAIEVDSSYIAYQNYANFLVFITNNPERAKKFVSQTLKIYPNSSNLYLDLAIVEYKLGNKKEALSAITKSYQIKPGKLNYEIKSQIERNLPLKVDFNKY